LKLIKNLAGTVQKTVPATFLFVFLVCSSLLSDVPENPIERKQIQEPLKSGEKLTIINHTGDIRIRRGAPEKFEAFAVIQNLQTGTPAPELKTERMPDGTVLSVDTPKETGTKPDRADLTVYVPDDISLECETFTGLIEIKGITANVSTKSDKGKILIRSVTGSVQASNGSGSVYVEFLSDVTKSAQELSTRTGDITLYVDEKIDSILHLETSGEISTDFSIQIDYDGRKEPDKTAKAKIGNAKNNIFARSKRGRIRLLRIVRSFALQKLERGLPGRKS
jgi:hypothetical protein